MLARIRIWMLLATLVAAVGCSGDGGSGTGDAGGEGRAGSGDVRRPSATFVGRDTCASCHAAEAEAHAGSHHDLAMQPATADTVLGDFDDATFDHNGVVSTFFRRDERYFVRTDGPDGTLTEYPIAYAFGVEPLQQYLIEMERGRLQALSICWDTRPREEGGQRWYHLYPDEVIPHSDELHWTKPSQNWNHMCAECHSTDLRKEYDLESDAYATRWSEIDVSCEACHGPGSRHVEWAKLDEAARADDASYGLHVLLRDRSNGAWIIDPETGNAARTKPLESSAQIDACARCHARRAVIREEYEHGLPFLETHLPALLEERLYHADGQILDEVYVYGSFLQSKMHAAGVRCTDCHEPHGLGLIAKGNTLCSQCHLASKYDDPSHHHHEPGTAGASCVECHMASRSYMVVDPRRDHGFRIPRPDQTVSIGTPNACTGCHDDRPAEWAAAAVDGWREEARAAGRSVSDRVEWPLAIAAGRRGAPDAARKLGEVASDPEVPGIVRGTALSLLGTVPGGVETMVELANGKGASPSADEDPVVRLGWLRGLMRVDPALRPDLAAPLLDDPILGVRAAAGRALAPVPDEALELRTRSRRDNAFAEWITTQRASSDRAWAHLNIVTAQAERGRFADAEDSFGTARRLDPGFHPALVNLADLYRMQGRDDEGEKMLRDALELAPDAGGTWHALGLLLVRQKRYLDAIAPLARAAELQPEDPHFGYVYAIAVHTTGDADGGVKILEGVVARHPRDPEILYGLATLERDRRRIDSALRYARRLADVLPGAPGPKALVAELESMR